MNTMKPSVIGNSSKTTANDVETGGVGRPALANGSKAAANGITIPINHEYSSNYTSTPSNYYSAGEAQPSLPLNLNDPIPQQQQQQHPTPPPPTLHHQQSKDHQIPGNIQSSYGFEPDMDMGMDAGIFPHNRFDPFHGFGRNSRKRGSFHNPHFQTDGFSRFDFDDDPDFGFPQFNSLSRRHNNVADDPADDDLFQRLSSEFRQYMPDNFGHRRPPFAAYAPTSNSGTPMATPAGINPMTASQSYNTAAMPMTNMRKFCDAAIQTDGAANNVTETDHARPSDKLRGYPNSVDMGVKMSPEGDILGSRSHSMPPRENQLPVNAKGTSPPVGSANNYMNQPPLPPHKSSYFAPQPDNQSKSEQTASSFGGSQTPTGSVVRTIPIFVEGRSEPIINDKEIPTPAPAASQTQSAEPVKVAATTARKGFPPHQKQQQQQRPPPLHTQRRQQTSSEAEMANSNLPPQTPQTMDSINKIQDIQHDVLELMSNVEKFTGTRSDKDYVYLDEMLTRNLLKLDNIDTNGKESIRLARKEAIKCIQASINVLEAKAEENSRKMQMQMQTPSSQNPNPEITNETKENQQVSQKETSTEEANAGGVSDPQQPIALTDKSSSDTTTDAANTNANKSNDGQTEATAVATAVPTTTANGNNNEEKSVNKIQEPIPLPAPEGMIIDVKQEEKSVEQQQQPLQDNNENEDQQTKQDPTNETQTQTNEERNINAEEEKQKVVETDTVKETAAEAETEKKPDDTTQSNIKDELNDTTSNTSKP